MGIGTLTVQNEQDKNEATKGPTFKHQIVLIGGAMTEVNIKGFGLLFQRQWAANFGR